MKRNLGNFTRGSQLLGHFGFMFAAGLRGPVIVALAVLAAILWSTLSARLTDHDQYLVWMRLYALGYRFLEFDPAKQVALEMAGGGHLQLPIGMLVGFPPVVLAWAKFLAALHRERPQNCLPWPAWPGAVAAMRQQLLTGAWQSAESA